MGFKGLWVLRVYGHLRYVAYLDVESLSAPAYEASRGRLD